MLSYYLSKQKEIEAIIITVIIEILIIVFQIYLLQFWVIKSLICMLIIF